MILLWSLEGLGVFKTWGKGTGKGGFTYSLSPSSSSILMVWFVDGLGLSTTLPLRVVMAFIPLVFWGHGLDWVCEGNLPFSLTNSERVLLILPMPLFNSWISSVFFFCNSSSAWIWSSKGFLGFRALGWGAKEELGWVLGLYWALGWEGWLFLQLRLGWFCHCCL